jgi:hypothetical protein
MTHHAPCKFIAAVLLSGFAARKSGLPGPPKEPAIRLLKQVVVGGDSGEKPLQSACDQPFYLEHSTLLQHAPPDPQHSEVAQELNEKATMAAAPARTRTFAIRFITKEIIARSGLLCNWNSSGYGTSDPVE